MPSLNDPGLCKAVATRLLNEIDDYCVNTYNGGHRTHLGASLIGHPCKRYLWFIFRWCHHEKTTGRQQRLFNRGHREEARFLEWLRGIGCEVSDVTEDGKQHRVIDCNGHFGGSLDGKGFLPAHYEIEEQILFEFKTKGTGSKFTNLKTKGMILEEHKHFCQMSVYGFKEKLNYGAYFSICKNDDDLHLEMVKLDHKLGEQLIIKAEQIITSQTAPARLSDNPTYYECAYCKMKGICHNDQPIEKNCRSCVKAYPVENAEWLCEHYNAIIPVEYIANGCPDWIKIL